MVHLIFYGNALSQIMLSEKNSLVIKFTENPLTSVAFCLFARMLL